MATLLIADSKRDATALAHERVVSLREWLQGRWAAVFSHPDDFAPPPSTPAGFITCIAEEIQAAGVKPIAFASSLDSASTTWLDHAVNDDAVVALDRSTAVIDLAERSLATALACVTQPIVQRFVLIVDERGRVRTTLSYRLRDRAWTLRDVIELIAVLRDGEIATYQIRSA